MYLHTYTCIHMHVQIIGTHTNTHLHTYTCTQRYIDKCTHLIHSFIFIDAYTHAYSAKKTTGARDYTYVHKQVRAYVYMHVSK